MDSLRSNAKSGGGVKRLPKLMANRAFEAQKIVYDDYDGDAASDEHDLASPVFMWPGSESTATDDNCVRST